MRNNTPEHNNIKKIILVYTLLFIVMAIGVYFIFICNDKTLLRFGENNVDGLAQRFTFFFEFKRFISNLFVGGQINTWDWSLGLGADAYNFNASSLFNPFNYFVCIFPDEFIDLGITYSYILRIYFSGIAFIAFAKKVELNELQIILGSISYAFSPWIIYSSTNQGHFLMGTILLPLVLLGVEKVLRKESPVFFILIVAYTLIVSLFWAYMIGIVTIMYYIVRRFTNSGRNSFATLMKEFGAFILYGVTGILVSCVAFAHTLIKYGGSTSVSGKSVPTLLSINEYMKLPSRFVCWDDFFGNYSYIGVTAIVLIMIPVIVHLIYKKSAPAIMTAILMFMMCVPFFNSMFNFFSYMTGRWCFIFIFFFVWAAMEGLDEKYILSKNIRRAIVGTFAIYSVCIAVSCMFMTEIQVKASILNCIAAAVLIVIVLWKYKTNDNADDRRNKIADVLIMAVLVVSVIAAYNVKFQYYEETDMDMFVSKGDAYRLLENSPQRVAQDIEDDGFYRVDQVEGVEKTCDMRSKINEAMYFGNRSVYWFSSNINVGWLEFNKMLGNNAGYYKRTAPNSNDNRMVLDLLLGVKYFIGNDKNGEMNASDYAGYGFDYSQTIDGVEILENKYSIGIGTVYTSYIKESEWHKLSYPEREMAMLQAIVVPDDYEASLDINEMKAEDIDCGVKEVSYDNIKMDGLRFDEEEKKITVEKENATLVLRTNNLNEGPLLVSLENLDRFTDGREREYSIYISNETIRKNAQNTMYSEQGFPDIEDITVNLGRVKNLEKITIEFPRTGEYTFDAIKMYELDTDIYNKYAGVLSDNSIKVEEFQNDLIKGNIEAPADGIVYMSLLTNPGWEVLIDGKEVETLKDVNVTFTGVEIKEGYHDIELEYHTYGFLLGLILTIVGLLLLAIIIMFRKKYIIKT